MRAALDDVRFLARSDHRISILDLLRDGPLTRSEIRDATGIPQATVGRILDDFLERNWATKESRTYRVLPYGKVLAEKFDDLVTTVESMQTIEGVARWLPADAPDPQSFADATVVVPTRTNVLAHIDRAERLLNAGKDVRVVTPSVFPDALRSQRQRSVEAAQRQLVVLAAEAIDVVLADPELAAITHDLIASGNVQVYRYNGPIECLLSVIDGTAVIGPLDEKGIPCAHIESTNPTVVEWVETAIRRYQDGATSLSLVDVPR